MIHFLLLLKSMAEMMSELLKGFMSLYCFIKKKEICLLQNCIFGNGNANDNNNNNTFLYTGFPYQQNCCY